MGKLTTFGLMAFACCATLTVAMGYGAGGMMGAGMMGGNMMYNRYPYMGGMGMTGGMGMKGGMMSPMVMPMPGYGGYGGGYGGGRGFSPVGQGGIMQFFFMLIMLMFMMELFQGFGDNNNGGDHYKK